MNKNNNYDKTTEENFLKNKAKRKHAANSNNKHSSANTKRTFKIIGIVLAAILGVMLAIVLGIAMYFFSLDDKVDSIQGFSVDPNSDNRATASNSEKANTESDIDIGSYKYYTFLATATDVSGNLTDVIMVARFHYPDDTDFEGPRVSVLQIPRDTYVKISSKLHLNDDGTLSEKNFDPKSGTYATKINTVFSHGRNLAKSTVNELLKEVEGKSDKEVESICKKDEYKYLNLDIDKVKKYSKSTKDAEKKELKANILKDFGITYLSNLIYHYFGIPIDYQAQVNIAGFRGIVDAIGGVDLDVPRRMYYKDPYQDLYIDLYPGYQHLDGKKAEQFVRFRRYVRGDIDRLDAQKLFINAFLDKLLSPSTVTKVDDIIVEIQDNLYTGISFNDLLRFTKKVLKMDLATDIAMHTLPGVGEYVGNVSYFIAYRNESCDLINKELNVYDDDFESSDLMMIDYNDLLSGSKPAISTSSSLTTTTTETKKEEAVTESNNKTNTSNESSNSSQDGETNTENASDETSNNGNSENTPVSEAPSGYSQPEIPYYEPETENSEPDNIPENEEAPETEENADTDAPEIQVPVEEESEVATPEEEITDVEVPEAETPVITVPEVSEPEYIVPEVTIPDEAIADSEPDFEESPVTE